MLLFRPLLQIVTLGILASLMSSCATTPGGMGLGTIFASSDKMVIEEKTPGGTFRIKLVGMGEMIKDTGLTFRGPTEAIAPDGSLFVTEPWEYSVNQGINMKSPALMVTAEAFRDAVNQIGPIVSAIGAFPEAGGEGEQRTWWQRLFGLLQTNPEMLNLVLGFLPFG